MLSSIMESKGKGLAKEQGELHLESRGKMHLFAELPPHCFTDGSGWVGHSALGSLPVV